MSDDYVYTLPNWSEIKKIISETCIVYKILDVSDLIILIYDNMIIWFITK